MVLTRTDENELLTALHSAVFEGASPWRLFLTRLRDRMEASMTAIYLRAPGDPVWRLAQSVHARSADAESFAPGLPPLESLRHGRVYSGAELPGENDWDERHLRIGSAEGGDLVLSVFQISDEFRARDASLLASLAPHLAIALRACTEMERERLRNRMSERLLERFAVHWLLLDTRGRVLDGDATALGLVEEGRLMRRSADGRLHLSHAPAEEVLGAIITSPERGDVQRAAWLGFDPPMQMVLIPAPDQQENASAQHFLVLRSVGNSSLGRGRCLQDLFHLTKSEAAVARELGSGASLAQAAENLGLTIETARNYSKRLYTKMSARGQVDVVRLLLGGISPIV